MRFCATFVAVVLPVLACAQERSGLELSPLCRPGIYEYLIFSRLEVAQCRRQWETEIDTARKRAELFRQLAVIRRERAAADEAARSASQTRAVTADPVTVDRFFEDSLSYGDVVVTSKGPKVFVGQAGGPVSDADFVPLASPRSPLRGKTKDYAGASP